MLEWLSSKMAVAVAAMLMLSSVTLYFANQRESVRRTEIENVGRGIADFVDGVLGLSGEVEFVAGCGGEVGLLLPSEIGGSSYSIRLRRDSVIVTQQDRTSVNHWTGDLHLWHAGDTVFDIDEIERLDAEYPSLELSPCQRFEIGLEEIELGGSAQLLAFANAED